MVTPLSERGDLDSQGLCNVIEHVLKGGVHGLFLLGTTGEGTSLSHALRKQVVSEACNLIDKRVPVLVCITDTSCEESLEQAEHAQQMGADALVVAPPYYLPISQGEMQQYLDDLAPRLPLPFLLYNMPSCTKLQLSLETIKKGKELGAIGIKDSSGDWNYLHSLIEEFGEDPTFSIVTGTESFLPKLMTEGGHGAVAGGANFFPGLFVALYNACLVDDTETISELLKQVKLIGTTIYTVGKQESKYIKGTKSVLSVLGLCHNQVAPPLRRFTPVEQEQIKGHLTLFPPDDLYIPAR